MEGIKITSKMKHVRRLVIKEELFKHKLLWIVFFVALVFSAWCNIPRFYIMTSISHDVATTINVVLQNLSFSIVAGIIVYFITEFIPCCRDTYNKLTSIANELYLLNKEIKSVMAVNSENGEKLSDKFSARLFMSRILAEDITNLSCKNELTPEECDIEVHFKPAYIFALNLIIEEIKVSLQSITLLSTYMDPQDMCLLPMVSSCRLFKYIEKRYSYEGDFDGKALIIRFSMLKFALYDYKFIRDGIDNLLKSYKRYMTLEDAD